MKRYELTYLISSKITEEEAKEIQRNLISFIQEQGGVLSEERPLLKKTLAYPIKKESRAYFITIYFQLAAEKTAELEKKIKSEDKILRYLLLTRKAPKTAAKLKEFFAKEEKKEDLVSSKRKKAELKEIEEKLEEILKEPR